MKHHCPRCGYESARKSWPEQHPAATVVIAVPSVWMVVAALVAHPWVFVPLLIVSCAVWVDRRQRRRSAILARADHDHRSLMARAVLGDRPRLRSRRGADHWSPTQPLRSARN